MQAVKILSNLAFSFFDFPAHLSNSLQRSANIWKEKTSKKMTRLLIR